jgi:dGTPase
VREAIKAFRREEETILAGNFAGDLIENCAEAARSIVTEAKRLAYEKVFEDKRKTQIEIGSYAIIDVLMTAFCDAFLEFKEDRASFKSQRVFSLLGVDAPRAGDELYGGLIRITDFVCGSTDRYATELSRRLSGVGFDRWLRVVTADLRVPPNRPRSEQLFR